MRSESQDLNRGWELWGERKKERWNRTTRLVNRAESYLINKRTGHGVYCSVQAGVWLMSLGVLSYAYGATVSQETGVCRLALDRTSEVARQIRLRELEGFKSSLCPFSFLFSQTLKLKVEKDSRASSGTASCGSGEGLA